jgi:ABC-type xylose transport system permease subunit
MLAKLIPRVAMLTAGAVIGISFVAQPLKFRADDVPLAHLVRAGSAIFHGSHALQLVVLCALVVLALLRLAETRGALGMLVAALGSLLMQIALMPAFDRRVEALAAGQPAVPAAGLHLAYVALELVKLAALLSVGGLGRGIREDTRPDGPACRQTN